MSLIIPEAVAGGPICPDRPTASESASPFAAGASTCFELTKDYPLAVAVDGLPCSQGAPAFAAADLRTGKLRNLSDDETTPIDNFGSASYAALADIVTIVGPLAGRTMVGLRLAVHGSVSGAASNGTTFFSAPL